MQQTREIKQLQFTAWPDHGVPDHPAPFLMFLKRVKMLNPPDCGPMIVHCSAGVGRTGCFVVIDSMLERMKYDNSIDVYGHVTCLRAQRNYMVRYDITWSLYIPYKLVFDTFGIWELNNS